MDNIGPVYLNISAYKQTNSYDIDLNSPIISFIGMAPPYSKGNNCLSISTSSTAVYNLTRFLIFSEISAIPKSSANLIVGCTFTPYISLCLIGIVFCNYNEHCVLIEILIHNILSYTFKYYTNFLCVGNISASKHLVSTSFKYCGKQIHSTPS